MKLIIAGGRDINLNFSFIINCLEYFNINKNSIEEIVSGTASGIDLCGETFADHNNITKKYFIPDWETHGKSAGPIRNEQMAKYSDCLLLIWNGESKGSFNMKKQMQKLNKPIYEVILKKL